MSIDTGMADVMSRIQSIQARFSAMAPTSTGTVGTVDLSSGSSTTGVADGATFAQALTAATTSTAGADSPSGLDVVADARKYLGVPYVWGGTDPAKGLDCSGLVQRVYRDLGIALPRVSGDQAKAGTAVASLADAKPGDLLAFGHPVHHIAIYLGNNKMIEAPHPGKNVCISPVYETPTAIRRIVADPTSATQLSVSSTLSPSITGTFSQRLAALQPMFAAAETKYQLPHGVLAALAQIESSCRVDAVSSKGASGLMQIMPGTARALGVDPMDPAQAIDGAARLLHSGLKAFGSLPLALAAYNAGAGAVRKYGGIPPYAETQAYVKNVAALMAKDNV